MKEETRPGVREARRVGKASKRKTLCIFGEKLICSVGGYKVGKKKTRLGKRSGGWITQVFRPSLSHFDFIWKAERHPRRFWSELIMVRVGL